MEKVKIDKILIEKGLAKDIEQARAFVNSGIVYEGDKKIESSSYVTHNQDIIRLLGQKNGFVSRGGIKLDNLISSLKINVKDLVAIDVGASTGGFTDCLIKRGASYVYSIDSGTNQLDWSLRNNPKVKSMEKLSIKNLELNMLDKPIDLVVCDVSFMSIKIIIETVFNLIEKQFKFIGLIKPQFEADYEEVSEKKGLIDDSEIQHRIIEDIQKYSSNLGYKNIQISKSAIKGLSLGNEEFFIVMEK